MPKAPHDFTADILEYLHSGTGGFGAVGRPLIPPFAVKPEFKARLAYVDDLPYPGAGIRGGMPDCALGDYQSRCFGKEREKFNIARIVLNMAVFVRIAQISFRYATVFEPAGQALCNNAEQCGQVPDEKGGILAYRGGSGGGFEEGFEAAFELPTLGLGDFG